MRKNKPGRPTKIKDVKEKVKSLRDSNFSYSEIGRMLGISKQLVRYHLTKKGKGI